MYHRFSTRLVGGSMTLSCEQARATVALDRTKDNYQEVDEAVTHVLDCPICKTDTELRARADILWPKGHLGPMIITGGCYGTAWYDGHLGRLRSGRDVC